MTRRLVRQWADRQAALLTLSRQQEQSLYRKFHKLVEITLADFELITNLSGLLKAITQIIHFMRSF
jgi:hypothetical protein